MNFFSGLHARGFQVAVLTPSCVSVTLLTGDRLVASFGRGNSCCNINALVHHAPNSMFSAIDAEVSLVRGGSNEIVETRGYCTPEIIESWIRDAERVVWSD